MKNMKIDWNTIATIIVVIGMTLLGIELMEEEFIEWMSGVIWIAGEAFIVGLITYKPIVRFVMDEGKRIYEKMLED